MNKLDSAFKNTEAGKLASFGNSTSKKPFSIKKLSRDDDIRFTIDNLDGIDAGGPGYEVNFDYYKNNFDSEDEYYFEILKDISDGTLKNESGEFADDKIISKVDSKLEAMFSKKGYDSPDIKLFYSPIGRRNTSKEVASFVDAKFKILLKKHFG